MYIHLFRERQARAPDLHAHDAALGDHYHYHYDYHYYCYDYYYY